ncbi:MAG TPA: hypothetical protein VFK50_11595 [Sphingomicrobium sp.]|nr:hypothetical protein [Sphingomicrobium sp.]
MAKLHLSKAWDETRAALARDGKLYGAIALALLALPATIFGTMAPEILLGGTPANQNLQLVFLFVLLLNAIGRIAISGLALRAASVGEAISHGLKRLMPVVGAFLLYVVPIALVLVPFLPRVMAAPESPPPDALLASTLILAVAFVVGVRLVLLLVPVAAAEAAGPIGLLKRSWQLTRGNWWRLTAFLTAFFLASILASRALGYAVGGVLLVAAGPIKAMSLSSLILAAVLALAGAAFTTVFSIMLARIYAQLAGPAHADVSVPSSGT